MGGKRIKKFQKGTAVAYISRTAAMRKLQLNIRDFKRLCIIKGIYPQEPKSLKKANKGKACHKTYFLQKDVIFLSHDKLIQNFRDVKVFIKKLKSAKINQETVKVKKLLDNWPNYSIDHVIAERYPTFSLALRDLDDCLSMVFLFSTFTCSKYINQDLIGACRTLSLQFLHYIIASKSLEKVFISSKGYYFQVEIEGQKIRWVQPHNLTYQRGRMVDLKLMSIFCEYYVTLLKFVNFKLYSSIQLVYPPKLETSPVCENEMQVDDDLQDWNQEILASLTCKLKTTLDPSFQDYQEAILNIDENQNELHEKACKEREEKEKLKNLFSGKKFFICRETPREILTFIVRCFGADVAWETVGNLQQEFDVNDKQINYQIVDRPNVKKNFINRHYLQPQWIFDCVNAGKLLDVKNYFTGVIMPPHLSPFYEDSMVYDASEDETVIEPVEKVKEPIVKIDRKKSQVVKGTVEKLQKSDNQDNLAQMMMSNKDKTTYHKLMKRRNVAMKEKFKRKRARLETPGN